MQHTNLQSAAQGGQLWVEHSHYVREQQRAARAEAQLLALRAGLKRVEAGGDPTTDQLIAAIVATMMVVILSFAALLFMAI